MSVRVEPNADGTWAGLGLAWPMSTPKLGPFKDICPLCLDILGWTGLCMDILGVHIGPNVNFIEGLELYKGTAQNKIQMHPNATLA